MAVIPSEWDGRLSIAHAVFVAAEFTDLICHSLRPAHDEHVSPPSVSPSRPKGYGSRSGCHLPYRAGLPGLFPCGSDRSPWIGNPFLDPFQKSTSSVATGVSLPSNEPSIMLFQRLCSAW